MPVAKRLQTLPPYIFAELANEIGQLRKEAREIFDLGISDPDKPPNAAIVNMLCREAENPESHRYPPYQGQRELRQAVADWYRERFRVELDPDREIIITGGSKAALVHLALAIVDPGRLLMVPDPGYPAYFMPHSLFGMSQVTVPLLPENQFLPNWEAMPESVFTQAALCYLNYPNNPTGALAPRGFWQQTVDLAQRHDFTVVSDLAYADIVYEGARASSIMEIDGAKNVAVESITFSKSFNMQGWRLGALVGSPDIIEAFYRIESQINAGVFLPVQAAGIEALRQGIDASLLKEYKTRRDYLAETLAELGFEVRNPSATVYFWIPTPDGQDSIRYSHWLLHYAGVAVTPGQAFGLTGRDHFRLSFTQSLKTLTSAMASLRKHGIRP